ncbi:CoA transferase [Oceanibium sediminis]|uniref:CoA transferase n=1 Tax=Oceanibium sediminis TaxID=2026339 RepID=UPI00130097DF|nr:CoA transferase [Oceanibium sediminis]
MIVAVCNDRQFAGLCAVLGVPELAGDSRFSCNPLRVENRQALTESLSVAISAWSSESFLTAQEARQVSAGPINTLEEVFKDPQVIARELVIHPKRVPGPWRFFDADLCLHRSAPTRADA